MTITVTPIQKINVTINQGLPQKVQTVQSFFGAANNAAQIVQISAQANQAFIAANTAEEIANSALANVDSKLSLSGGTITGDLDITGNLVTSNVLFDGGTF